MVRGSDLTAAFFQTAVRKLPSAKSIVPQSASLAHATPAACTRLPRSC